MASVAVCLKKVITLVEQEKLPIEVPPITIPDEYVEHGNVDIFETGDRNQYIRCPEKIEKELGSKMKERLISC